jgi:phage terminase large subunit-like protein
LEVFSGSTDADGFQSGYAVGDEIALQDGQLYNLIYDGQANLPQSQLIGISTAGFNIGGWCHKKYKGIKANLEANTLPDNLFVFITEPDKDDDFGDPMTWAKANPLLFFTLEGDLRQDKIDYYCSKYQQALQMGGRNLTSFYTKQMNHWCAAADTLLCDFDSLDQCFYDFTFQNVLDNYKQWYLGVDLAQTMDLNAIAFLSWIKISKDKKLLPNDANDYHKRVLYINVLAFMPEATLQRHISSDKFAYNKYVGKELFLTTGAKGLRTSYDEIVQKLQNIKADNEIEYVTIACDPYGVASIQNTLEEMCGNLILQSQHRKALSPYIEQFNTFVMNENFAFSKDSSDILMKAIRNSVVSQTDDGYLQITKPTKDQSTNYRIDPVDALIDGMIAPIIDKDKYEEVINYDEVVDEWFDIYK